MLYPPMADLLKHINSRYLLVNVVAHRARQISIEADTFHTPWRKSRSRWPLKKWQRESSMPA